MTFPNDSRQEPFQNAWFDLSQRLLDAIVNLTSIRAKSQDETDRQRLADKFAAVVIALEVLHNLEDAAIADGGDYAGAWRLYTDKMTARLNEPGHPPGYYSGISLAMDYQRGYGPDVDAPRPILPPHAR